MPKTIKKYSLKSKRNNITKKITKKSTKNVKSSVSSTKSSSSKSSTKSDKIITIPSTLEKYIPPYNPNRVYPKIWELPNRKTFFNWVMTTFEQYELGNPKKHKAENPRIKEQMALNNVQRLNRDFFQGESPGRGVLLFVGLGVGKTAAAITISEAILTKKEVIVMSKSSLEGNFRKELRKWGSDYVKTANHWVFHKCDTEVCKALAEKVNIPAASLRENGGAFFVDFTNNNPNYNDMTSAERTKLDNQIEHIIDDRFRFIHTDDTRILNKLKDNEFDDKIVIIDEVHNLSNTMASDSVNGLKYYELFMNAKNPKYIFLSGTPIINKVYEVSKLFNILRGYMDVLDLKFKTTFDVTVNYDKIKYALKQNKQVDQVIIRKSQKMISITKNPDNFITHPDGKGVIYRPEESIDFATFVNDVSATIMKMGYKIITDTRRETCFPIDRKEFEMKFYNPELNKLKNIDLIKRRIVGLTSYYDYQNKDDYPQLLAINKVQIPMSEYQFGFYERFRHDEIQKEKTQRRQKDDDDSKMTQSNYRLKSRMTCSFAFPEELGSLYDSKKFEDKLELMESIADKVDEIGVRLSHADEIKSKDLDRELRKSFLEILDKGKAKFLDMKNGSLAKYSPKYYTMISNIMKEKGKILVYSYYKNLIGLNTFALALIQTGKWAPFEIKKVNKEWEMVEREEDMHKAKFIFYSGDESQEVREIYRKIYNSEWDALPTKCSKLVKQIKEIHPNNYYGEVIKMIMITRTGAEGLDLKEVRHIHIMEPYWQPVLISQIIGRGVRNRSHLKLAKGDRTVEVFIYMATIPPNLVRKISYIDVRNDIYKYSNPALADKANKVVSSDEYLFLTAERKKYIINEFQKLMKETAFDCTLNYKENKLNPDNKGLICMDYPTKNRDDYLFTPSIDDTVEGIDLAQEKVVAVQYGVKDYKGKKLYYNLTPTADGKMYIYNENLVGRVRLPKAVGEVKIVDGKRQLMLYAKKGKK